MLELQQVGCAHGQYGRIRGRGQHYSQFPNAGLQIAKHGFISNGRKYPGNRANGAVRQTVASVPHQIQNQDGFDKRVI